MFLLDVDLVSYFNKIYNKKNVITQIFVTMCENVGIKVPMFLMASPHGNSRWHDIGLQDDFNK